MKEREIDALATLWTNAWVAHLLSVQWATATVEDSQTVGKTSPSKNNEVVVTKMQRPYMPFLPMLYPLKQRRLILGRELVC